MELGGELDLDKRKSEEKTDESNGSGKLQQIDLLPEGEGGGRFGEDRYKAKGTCGFGAFVAKREDLSRRNEDERERETRVSSERSPDWYLSTVGGCQLGVELLEVELRSAGG